MFFNEPQPKTLIVVCKDELLTNQLKKYVETNDDKDEVNIVGTKDGSVKIVAWNQKVWLDNKNAGNIDCKVLLIGNVKGSDKLIPIIDVKFDRFGIKYGWAGNQAILTVNPNVLSNEKDYEAFFEELQKTTVSDAYKQKVEKGNKPKETADNSVESTKQPVNEVKNVFAKIGQFCLIAIDPIHAGIGALIDVSVRYFGNKEKIEKQQFFYGITRLYEDHLEEFLK